MKVKVGLLLSLLAIFALIILGVSSVATAGPKLSGIDATDASGTGPLVHYVSERVPVRGESVERGAMARGPGKQPGCFACRSAGH